MKMMTSFFLKHSFCCPPSAIFCNELCAGGESGGGGGGEGGGEGEDGAGGMGDAACM